MSAPLTDSVKMELSTTAHAYGPFGLFISNWVYKECHIVEWQIGNGPSYGLAAYIEICAYYDADYELLGFSMTIVR
ncbi:MAG: hypothetical protein OXC80_08870 [Gammaproteobacteria bacterium]|nr:hypothetical protein [Gammaproteobacteria bacterium]